MKRLLVLFIMVLVVFSFEACKNEPIDFNKDKNAIPVSKEQGKAMLIEQGSDAKAIDHTGFSFVITTGEGDKLAVGGVHGIFWVGLSEGDEPMEYAFFKEEYNNTYMYRTKSGNQWYSLEGQPLIDFLFSNIESTLFFAHENESIIEKAPQAV